MLDKLEAQQASQCYAAAVLLQPDIRQLMMQKKILSGPRVIVKRLLLCGADSTSIAFLVESCRQHLCITHQEHLLMKLQHNIGHHTMQRIVMWYDGNHQLLGQKLAASPII